MARLFLPRLLAAIIIFRLFRGTIRGAEGRRVRCQSGVFDVSGSPPLLLSSSRSKGNFHEGSL